jgi:hypothetical protein
MDGVRPSAAAAALLVALLVLGAASGAATPRLKVVATGLNSPRKIFIASDGAVYVAESGTGGPYEASFPGKKCTASCVGTTGSITRIANGRQTRVVTGLASSAGPTRLEAEGPAATIVSGKTYYVLMQNMGINPAGQNIAGIPTAGDLLTTPGGNAKPKVIANFATFEAAHNPDHGRGPGTRYGQPPIDSDPYGFIPYRGGFAVVDSAANDLLWLSPNGRISVLAVFPTQPIRLTAAEAKKLGSPGLKALQVQSVPTSVVAGPDGALYVGELTGWPYRVGSARIWRVAGGKLTLFAKGFTNISDLAFEGKNLLVLEIAEKSLLDPTSPGALIRVAPNGSRKVLMTTGLGDPTGLAVGNGSIYISNYGIFPGTGKGPHGELVSLPASFGA